MKTKLLARHCNIKTGYRKGFLLKLISPSFLLIAILFAFNARAQNVNTYDFSASSGNYVPISTTAGATAVPVINVNEAISGALPIGFTFNYAGNNYNFVYASSNGFLSFFGASPLPINDLETASLGSLPLIAPLWDGDLSGATGTASYQTTGTAGNRVFTFQWANWDWFGKAVPVISFQVKLYEGTAGKMEFIYRREPHNGITYGTASIGLAGPSPGSADYLALSDTGPNPTVSSSTPNSGHRNRPATGQVYTFTKSTLKDLQAISLTEPIVNSCGSNQQVTVTIKNGGAAPLDFSNSPGSVNVRITHPDATVTTFPSVALSNTLAVNATQDITVTTAAGFNMSAGGTYDFNIIATVAGDGKTSNDTLDVSRTVSQAVVLPVEVNFTGYNSSNLGTVFPGWYEAQGEAPSPQPGNSYWQYRSGLGGSGNRTAYMDFARVTDREWIIGPKLTAQAGTELRFKAAIDNGLWGPATSTMAGTDDKLQVMVSTDCGKTFTPIYTYDGTSSGSLTHILTEQAIPLSTFAGQNIILAFFASAGTIADGGGYNFHIDDLFIGTPPPIDLGVTSFTAPASSGCYSSAENVIVTIKNFGTDTLKFNLNPASVSVQVKNNNNQLPSLTATLSGNLIPGASQTVNLSPALNMSPSGTYSLKAISSVSGDNNKTNDTVEVLRSVSPVFPIPQNVNFTGFNGSNLNTAFPGWQMAKGQTPTGTVANWAGRTGLGNATNVTAAVTLANTKKEWIIGPKIVPGANTTLRFKTAITAANSNGPYATGMAGTDDKVQVMLSLDCGFSYSPIFIFDAANTAQFTNALSEQVIALSAYAGQNVIIAFYATDGPVNDFKQYAFHLDDIVIANPANKDIEVLALTSPAAGQCYGNAENVTLSLKNSGSDTIKFVSDNTIIKVKITGTLNATLTDTIKTGMLLPGSTMSYTFSSAINIQAAGNYNFKAYAVLPGDLNNFNDTVSTSRSSLSLTAIPMMVNFSGFNNNNLNVISPGWYEASGSTRQLVSTNSWEASSPAQTSAFGSVGAKVYFSTASLTTLEEWIISPKFSATPFTHLKFKAAATENNTLAPALMGVSDTVFIMVSTDCGGTFRKYSSINRGSNLTTGLSPFDISLASLSSQQVILAFYAKTGQPRHNLGYDFHLDDIEIRNVYPTDLRPIRIEAANSGCGLTANEEVCIVVKNEGTTVQANISVGYRVNTPGNFGNINFATIPGSLAPGDTVRYCFSVKANLAANNTYTIQAFTRLSTDGLPENDTLSKIVNSGNPVTITPVNASRCGPGLITLSPTTPNNVALNWYSSNTGGSILHTGTTFTPNITASTTYYLVPAAGTEITGKLSHTTTGTNVTGTSGHLKFNAAQAFKLESVVVYTDNAAGGPINIVLNDAANNPVHPVVTFTLPPVSGKTAITIPLNWNIPAGSNYTLAKLGSGSLYRDIPPATGSFYPIVSPSQIVTITNGSSAGYYYFFYNWVISTGCTATRVPITATINPAPAVNLGQDKIQCAGTPISLNAGNAGATFQWYRNNTLINGAINQTYSPVLSGTYVSAVTSGGCTSYDTVQVTVNPTPATPTITQSGGMLTSSATTGNQWYLNGSPVASATGSTFTPTANGNYTVVATVNGCESAVSNGVNVIIGGISKHLDGSTVSVYPNPSCHGNFTVKLTGYAKEAVVSLYTLTGQELKTLQLKPGTIETAVAAGQLPAGVYVLKVTSGSRVNVLRVLVE